MNSPDIETFREYAKDRRVIPVTAESDARS